MPIIKSAKKALKQSIKREVRNNRFKDLYKEARVAFEKALKEKDVKKAREILVNEKDKEGHTSKSWLQSIIDKLVKKNILHPKNGARKKSLFVKRLKDTELALKSK